MYFRDESAQTIFTCCHTEMEAADQTFHLTQSQYTDTGPTSPSADPITPGAWQKRREKSCSGTLSVIKGAPLSNDQQYKQTTKRMAIQELLHPMTLTIRASEALDRMMEGSAPGTDTVAFLHIKNLSEYCSVNLKVLHQYRASRRSCPRRQGAQGSTTSIACDLGLVSWGPSTVK